MTRSSATAARGRERAGCGCRTTRGSQRQAKNGRSGSGRRLGPPWRAMFQNSQESFTRCSGRAANKKRQHGWLAPSLPVPACASGDVVQRELLGVCSVWIGESVPILDPITGGEQQQTYSPSQRSWTRPMLPSPFLSATHSTLTFGKDPETRPGSPRKV